MTSRAPNRRIAAEAADWAVRIDAGPLNAGEKAQLAEWLRTSPVHIDELLFSASLTAGLAHVDPGRSLSVESLLTDVAPKVIPLSHGPNTSGEEEPTNADGPIAQEAASPRALTRYWPAIAASLLIVLAGSWYGLNHPSAPTVDVIGGDARLIAAEGAEPQPIALEDGSVLYMNEESHARARFSETRRVVELLEGRALFDVAHDRDRLFQVLAAGTRIEALGTKFTVEHGDRGVSVAVREGKVRVIPQNDAPATGEGLSRTNSSRARHPLQLEAGQEAFVFTNGETTVNVSTFAPTAWELRHLSYKNESLSVIAAEFNRFNAVKIAVADPELAMTRFSGVFDAHDPETFIAFLELSAGVRVEKPREGQIVLTMIE